MRTIRLLLADDHSLVRAALRSLLEHLPGFAVVGEASDGQEALQRIRALRPDVALLDIGMPVMNGLEATGEVARSNPRVKVLILSMHSSEEYVLQALRAGAAGYLLKDASTAELEVAIRAVAAGGTYLSPEVSKHVVAEYVRRVGNDPTSSA